MLLVEPVKAAIHQCFNFYNYSDAAFLSERLYAEVSSPEALYLLGSSYYLMRKPWKAYMALSCKKVLSPDCRYLLAKCCLELNKLNEAELALTKHLDLKKEVNEIKEDFGEVASFALNILGLVCSNTERKEQAVYCFKESLQLNPFLWSSFQMLCELGDTTDPVQTFKMSRENLASVCKHPSTFTSLSFIDHPPSSLKQPHKHDDSIVKSHIELFASFTGYTPDSSLHHTHHSDNEHDIHNLSMPTNPLPRRLIEIKESCHNPGMLSPLTPKFGMMPLVFTPAGHDDTSSDVNLTHNSVSPIVNTVTSKTSQGAVPLASNPKPAVFSQSGNNHLGNDKGYNMANGGPRRSTRLFNHNHSSVKENKKSQLIENRPMHTGVPRSICKKTKSKLAWTPLQNPEKKLSLMTSTVNNKSASTTMLSSVRCKSNTSLKEQRQQLLNVVEMQQLSASGLIQLLQQLASAYQALSQYNCSEAISLFKQLPPHHYNTGWVLCQVGKAYFELCDYQNSEKVFSEARRIEGHRMEGMEVYSTVLWHLQLEVDLSALAHELTIIDKLSPEAWCATGNCFSLQKEHDTAIKFFQRAIQVEPSFTYAYTLLGHEYALIEELDKAMTSFQNAIRINERHYNAWYGLGMVHYKQEKFSLAGLYFDKALAINSHSSALLCHIGVVQHAQKDSFGALNTFDNALLIDPRNPLCKFHKASVLFANERPQEALKELDELKQIVPKESLVYFLIGKIHRKLGNTHLALINFSWAMDLDPKGTNNHIKETINKRYVVDDDDPHQEADRVSLLGQSMSDMSDSRPDEDSSNNSQPLFVTNDTATSHTDDDDDVTEFGFMNIGY